MAAVVPPATVVLSYRAVSPVENVPLLVFSHFAEVQC